MALRFFLFAFSLALPFLGRAFFVDDHYHLQMAEGLLHHPSRPYDFRADDDGVANAGWERGQPPRMVNPPLHHYMMAGLLKVSGGRVWVVRLGMAVFSALSVIFIGLIARRCWVPPGPAMLLTLLTPAFWVSSYALLIDSTMLVFFLGGLAAWMEGLKRGTPWLLVAAGFSMGAAILTKYTGAFVVPLAGLYWLLEGDSRGQRPVFPLAALLIPAALLAGWSAWNVAVYGAPHLTESSKRVMQVFSWSHLVIFFSFFSGVFLFPLAAWHWTSARFPRATWTAGISAALLGGFLCSRWGGFSPFQAYFLAFLSATAILFFLQSAVTAGESGSKTDLFLGIWLLVGSVQMVYVMQWVAARYYLTILPPAVLLLLRAWDRELSHFPRAFSRRVAGAGVALFAATLSIAIGDHLQAGTHRRVVEDASRDGWAASGRTRYSLGDSFSGGDLSRAGWRPLFEDTPLKPGDLVLQPQVVMPRWWFKPRSDRFRVLAVYEYRSWWPFRVMDNRGSAGFYASAWGALPFTLSRGPLERFLLLEVLPSPVESGGPSRP